MALPFTLRRALTLFSLLAVFSLLFLLAHAPGPERLTVWNIQEQECDDRAMEKGEGDKKKHPIFGLMREGEKRWKEVYGKQSSTLEGAVDEYERRYGLPPPAGFDAWFHWSHNASVHFLDEFDALHETMSVFRGLSPENLVEQMSRDGHWTPEKSEKYSMGPPRTFEVWVKDGRCGGMWEEHWPEKFRSRSGWEVCHALREVVHLLPDIPKFVYSTMDEGTVTVSWAEKERLRNLAKTKTLLPPAPHWTPTSFFDSSPSHFDHRLETGYVALAQSCSPDSSARKLASIDPFTHNVVWEDSSSNFALPLDEGGFVFDAKRATDVCENTSLRKTQGILLQWPEVSSILKGRDKLPESELRPVFSQSKFSTQSDILVPQLYGYLADVDWPEVPWEEKQDKLVWRGTASGVYYAGSHTIGGDWREGQRQTLHRLCTAKQGFLDYVWATNSSILQRGTMKASEFTEEFFECGLSSYSTCGYDGCETVKSEITLAPTRKDYENFKFIADVDGYGWSGRFRGLLLSRSMIIKATAFPEWFEDRLVPWYHYVPMRYNYLDLPSILAFFAGSNTPGTTPKFGEHHELARLIGARGRKFVEEHWRKEDLASYLWRVLLEYRRLYQPQGEGDLRLEGRRRVEGKQGAE